MQKRVLHALLRNAGPVLPRSTVVPDCVPKRASTFWYFIRATSGHRHFAKRSQREIVVKIRPATFVARMDAKARPSRAFAECGAGLATLNSRPGLRAKTCEHVLVLHPGYKRTQTFCEKKPTEDCREDSTSDLRSPHGCKSASFTRFCGMRGRSCHAQQSSRIACQNVRARFGTSSGLQAYTDIFRTEANGGLS